MLIFDIYSLNYPIGEKSKKVVLKNDGLMSGSLYLLDFLVFFPDGIPPIVVCPQSLLTSSNNVSFHCLENLCGLTRFYLDLQRHADFSLSLSINKFIAYNNKLIYVKFDIQLLVSTFRFKKNVLKR